MLLTQPRQQLDYVEDNISNYWNIGILLLFQVRMRLMLLMEHYPLHQQHIKIMEMLHIFWLQINCGMRVIVLMLRKRGCTEKHYERDYQNYFKHKRNILNYLSIQIIIVVMMNIKYMKNLIHRMFLKHLSVGTDVVSSIWGRTQ